MARTLQLQSGDYRWVEVPIDRVPAEIELSYSVEDDLGSVHVEFLSEAAFKQIQHGATIRPLAATPEAHTGTLRYSVQQPGMYRLVIMNRKGAPPTSVAWSMALNQTRGTEVPRERRFQTIVVSFLLFFAMVGYSGWKLRNGLRE